MQDIILLPTWNEVENVVPMVRALLGVCSNCVVQVWDDRSSDGTVELVKEEFGGDSRVEVYVRSGERGLGRTYREAYAKALESDFRFLVQIDCDFSHDPSVIPVMFGVLERGEADLVIGSRYVHGGGSSDWPWHRLLLSRVGGVVGSVLSGLPVRDITGGFLAFTRSALEKLDPSTLTADGFSIQFEVRCRAHEVGLRMKEVPIVFRDRERGFSKMKLCREIAANLRVAVKYRGRRNKH